MRRNDDERDNTIDAVMDAYTSGVGYGAFENAAFVIHYTHGTGVHAFRVKITMPERFNRPIRVTFKEDLSEYVSVTEIADAIIGVIIAFNA